MKVTPTGDTTFLAFTICPTFEEAYVRETMDQMLISRSDFRDGFFYGNISHPDYDYNLQEGFDIFEKATYELDQILREVEVSTEDLKDPRVKIYEEDKPLNLSLASWKPTFNDVYGRCFSMELDPKITMKGIINIVFMSKIGIHVFLHHPGQKMDVDSKTKVEIK